MRQNAWRTQFLLVGIAILAELSGAQSPQPSGSLAVNGYSGQIPVIQIDGKSYIEIDALARLTMGAIAYPANQMTLTLTVRDPADAPPRTGFSGDFIKAGIEAMTAIREWRASLLNALEHTYPLQEPWLQTLQRTAESKRTLAGVAAMTDADKSALPLLENELAMMQKMSDTYLGMYKSVTYIDPTSLDNNPLNQQILECARGLAALAASGQFQDVPSCH